jgi:prepilin signal peptidase PulO-like enzyme (type II secretory pathway)
VNYIILFIFGAFIGSFLNVVAGRWGRGPSIVSGRSSCPHCGRTLKWYELVPILSFVALRGKCGSCGARISLQYPLVEIWTGLLFASIYYSLSNIYPEFRLILPASYYLLPILHYLILISIFSIYTIILIYDLHHKIIPDLLVYLSIALALLYRIVIYHLLPVESSTLDWLAGPIIFLFSRGRAMGFGDAKLGLSLGLLLGASNGFSAIVLAFWVGAGISLFLVFKKGFRMKSEVPFAPFMILGALLSLILNLNILNVAIF